MNLIKSLFGAIGKIFGAIFGIFSAKGKGKEAGGDFYLTEADAKGFTETKKAPKTTATAEKAPAKAQTAKTATTANALNLPQPTITVSAAEPEPVFNQFGPRRRPGANMKAYLDMAKATKVPVR